MKQIKQLAWGTLAIFSLSGMRLLATEFDIPTLVAEKCASCHGSLGEKLGTPNVFGLSTKFLDKSLKAFIDGKRNDIVLYGAMGGVAQNLAADFTPEQLKELTTYLSEQDACTAEAAEAVEVTAEQIHKGEEVVTKLRCATCHKQPSAMGAPQLEGQRLSYLISSLKAFKSKARVSPMMNSYAAKLSEEDIANVAAYYYSQGTCAP